MIICQDCTRTFPIRFTSLNELQARIERTRWRSGKTFTAMAMRKALELFSKDVRQDEDTTKVTDDDDMETESTK